MAIATHTNKRPSAAHKKRTGQHQKQTKHYLKTYWPYIPVFVIAGTVNALVSGFYGGSSVSIAGSLAEPTRMQLWMHTSYSVAIAICLVAFVGIAYVFAHHAAAWHRALVKGEEFVVNHHLLDVAIVGFALLGIIVTRSV